MTKQNVKLTWQSPNSQKLGCFRDKSESESHNPLIFFHYKSSSVMFFISSDSDQNLSIGFWEKCQQTLLNGLKLQNRFIYGYHDPLVREIIWIQDFQLL